MRYLVIYTLLLLAGCTPLAPNAISSEGSVKVLRFADQTYEPEIKTVVIHPASSNQTSSLLPAVTKLGGENLILEFDDLTTQRDTYYARIFHCNYDWTKSILMDLDYMIEYNEFPINNFEFSVDSHVPYVHYRFVIPQVKLPGNYVLVVYRGSDKNDLILSKRFMVYDNRVAFLNERNLIGAGDIASLNQQINFTINYKDLDIINPLDNVKVVIRQNQRWDNIATDVRPSFVREIEKEIEYRFFDENKMFKGGSEFRFFDMRSLNYPGRNVARVNKSVKPFELYLEKDKSRANEAYSQYDDLNGGFILDNLDYRDASFANYAFVNFTLVSKDKIPGDVYVTGAFQQWNLNKENKMYYDTTNREYTAQFLLKQGWYDYQYVVKSNSLPPYALEGSHYETENMYEIFVYYQPFQPKADMLIGYLNLYKNKR
ncbi:DUF5103 domain-containing protein [Chryseosolibacter indicus]|uniref:DUF5103 domain-containing protein n=1 Tax=Chryseosolibacter indicus TaxID=2782351 RepID=A0ABS5VPY5_9BACT|nr:DUF5103 domain-containing protein [Chryseosolibacter indicus]MBT1703416.1 DUF5103 domain-containing protein [Chryseosolibacter indicus]